MGFFFFDDFADCRASVRIDWAELRDLVFEMTQDDFFYSDCGGSHGRTAEKACNYSQGQAAETTEIITAATAYTADGQVFCEVCPVAFFVGLEFQ